MKGYKKGDPSAGKGVTIGLGICFALYFAASMLYFWWRW